MRPRFGRFGAALAASTLGLALTHTALSDQIARCCREGQTCAMPCVPVNAVLGQAVNGSMHIVGANFEAILCVVSSDEWNRGRDCDAAGVNVQCGVARWYNVRECPDDVAPILETPAFQLECVGDFCDS